MSILKTYQYLIPENNDGKIIILHQLQGINTSSCEYASIEMESGFEMSIALRIISSISKLQYNVNQYLNRQLRILSHQL